MISVRQLIAIISLVWVLAAPSAAHEVNPALLEITERTPGQHHVLWKQPLKDGRRLRITPVFPDTCARGPVSLEAVGGAVIERWALSCQLDTGQITLDGLERTLTDVFVRIVGHDGAVKTHIVRPGAPHLILAVAPSTPPILAYVWIGVEHILFGYDHLLFVLGLCLLVRLNQLVSTITAFTLAHSVTLCLSTLSSLSLPAPPVEATIALSIVLLAREALALQAGHQTWTRQKPWLVAFGFGLIHGFGFAGALSDIGLPEHQAFWTLLLFNIGVELGQLVFVCLIIGLAMGLWRILANSKQVSKVITSYVIGTFGTLWFIERLAAFGW